MAFWSPKVRRILHPPPQKSKNWWRVTQQQHNVRRTWKDLKRRKTFTLWHWTFCQCNIVSKNWRKRLDQKAWNERIDPISKPHSNVSSSNIRKGTLPRLHSKVVETNWATKCKKLYWKASNISEIEVNQKE